MKREHTRATISAKFLLAAPPPATTVIPDGFKIKKLAAKQAQGAYKPKIAPRGDAPTIYQAARATQTLVKASDRRRLLNYAARGF
jgi:hypothetical protein